MANRESMGRAGINTRVKALAAGLALLMGVAGLGGCSAAESAPEGSPAAPSTTPAPPTPSPTHPASPVTVPFDPGAGLDVAWCCRVLGVWDNVAVVTVQVNNPRQGQDHGGDSAQITVLRGIDVTTGEVLWTHNGWGGTAMVSGGRLALAGAGGGVEILSLATGDVLATGDFFVDSEPGTSTAVRLSAYQDGIIVTDQVVTSMSLQGPPDSWDSSFSQSWEATVAYRDTDLQTPLWQVKANDHPGLTAKDVMNAGYLQTERTVGPLVKTASLGWVDVQTGNPSHMSVYDGEAWRVLSSNNGWMIDAAKTDGSLNSGVASLSGWDDPMADKPKWTYTPPEGWVIVDAPLVGCSSGEALVVRTKQGDELGEPGQATPSTLSAIRYADGQLMWSIPYDSGTSGTLLKCAVVSAGGKEYVVYSNGSHVQILDAADGSSAGEFQVLGESPDTASMRISGVEECGEGRACVIANSLAAGEPTATMENERFRVTAVVCGPGEPSSPWSVTVRPTSDTIDQVFPTQAGLVIAGQPETGVFQWVIM